jgi:S1-C subfamily serine protease
MRVAQFSREMMGRYASAVGMSMLLLLAGSLASAGNPDEQDGAYLGVSVGDMSAEQASRLKLNSARGAFILSLDQDGPACRAGLKARDVIVAVDGKSIRDSAQLASLMHSMQGGKVADVSVLRDGQQQEVKVTLGRRHEWMSAQHPMPPVPNTKVLAAGPLVPMPPVAYPTVDVEVPVYTPSSARRGLVVESLNAQLGEFFGVPRGQGVLVRNVQKGSTAAHVGLRAGDVIVRINGDPIRDLADWRRSMNALSGKASFSVIRDKREQTIEMNLPSPTSRLGSAWASGK